MTMTTTLESTSSYGAPYLSYCFIEDRLDAVNQPATTLRRLTCSSPNGRFRLRIVQSFMEPASWSVRHTLADRLDKRSEPLTMAADRPRVRLTKRSEVQNRLRSARSAGRLDLTQG